MTKSVSAVFDSADAAELALISLHRKDIPLISSAAARVENAAVERDIFNLAPIFATRGIEATNQSIAPLPIISQPLNSTRRRLMGDVLSDDVRLTVEVPENFASRTRMTMVSCHGRSIAEE